MEQAGSEFAAAEGKFASGWKGRLVINASHTHQKNIILFISGLDSSLLLGLSF